MSGGVCLEAHHLQSPDDSPRAPKQAQDVTRPQPGGHRPGSARLMGETSVRISVIAATIFWLVAAGPTWALQWLSIDDKHGSSIERVLSDSAYVDRATGLIHVVICTGADSCPDASDLSWMNDVRATDAVIDCARHTITWQDNFEGTNVGTVVSRIARSQVAHRDPFDRSRRIDILPTSDEGRVFATFCAHRSMLPERLAPSAAGAGFSVRLVDGEGAGPAPAADDQRARMREAPGQAEASLWLRPEAIVDRTMLDDARAALDRNGRPVIDISLTEEGARRVAAATESAEGKRMAIVVDGEVLAAPEIRQPIPGGRLEITGAFTAKSADMLARSIAVWTEHPLPSD